MTFFGIIKYLGILLLAFMAVVIVVVGLIGVGVTFSPTLIPGLFQS
jgi:hypothetical protein